MTIAKRSRLRLYLPLLALLAALVSLSLWTVTDSGAYLTDDGDWQGKAGQYRIGVIDYVVEADGSAILSGTGEGTVDQLVIPLKGGVRFYDPTLTDDTLRLQEFNEGATVLKLRVVNRSDSLVEISAALNPSTVQTTSPLFGGAEGAAPLRLLALPTVLREADLGGYDYRSFALTTLGLSDHKGSEAAGLAAMTTAFTGRPAEQISGAVIRGATRGTPVGEDYILEGSTAYYYKDLFFLLWCEYGSGSSEGLHNSNLAGAGVILPTMRLGLTMSVGQLD